MKSEQFLQVAKLLVSESSAGPAECRTAISRAYYAVFHTLLQFVERDLGISITPSGGRDNTHLLLRHYFANCHVPEAESIARMLRDLHDDRKAADYDLDDADFDELVQAQACIMRAEQMLEKVEVLRRPPQRQHLIAGLTQYKKLRQGLS